MEEAREELDYCLFKANAWRRREEMSSLRQAPWSSSIVWTL